MQRAGFPAALLGAILATGCLVEVRHVSDPGRAFDQARAEAARVAGRKGPAHHLNVLVYDPGDEKLVRVSVPLWLARKIARHGTDEIDFDGDDEVSARVRERLRHRVKLEEIEKAGLGTLVEVEDDDGTQILVWLR